MDRTVNMMIIGAQKAGTTSLNNYLSQHPKIYTHKTLEFGLFLDKDSYNKGLDYYLINTVSQHDLKNQNKSVFVAKRVGLMNNELMLHKLYEFNSGVKIVIVLRNPIHRAYSAFLYCKQMGLEPYDDFDDAIFVNDPARFKGNAKHQNDCDYVGRSSYLAYIKKVYSIFPKENVRLFLFEEMLTEFNKHLNEMCSLVGIDQYGFDTSVKYNEASNPKSYTLAKLVASGKRNRLKNFVPLKFRIKLKQSIKDINRRNDKPEVSKKNIMSKAAFEYLKSFFLKDVKDLESFTKLPIQKYWPELFN